MKRGFSKSSNWIRLNKRLSIYHRDGFNCVWCQLVFPPAEPYGYGLCLDHVQPGRGNGYDNVVTACGDCNVAKHDRPLDEWLPYLSSKHGESEVEILARVERQLHAAVDIELGKCLARERRPNFRVRAGTVLSKHLGLRAVAQVVAPVVGDGE